MMERGKRTSRRRGFTLVEMIIAIGAIAVFSGLVLQLFITARNLNVYSGDLDSGTSAAVRALETFKKVPDAKDVFLDGSFGDAAIDTDGSRSRATIRFDGDWNELSPLDGGDAVFVMTAVLTRDAVSDGMWNLSVRIEITDLYRVESRRGDELVMLTASRFGPAKGGTP